MTDTPHRVTVHDAVRRALVRVESERIKGEGRLVAVTPASNGHGAAGLKRAKVLIGGSHYTVPIEAVEVLGP